ncbi:hypothetical protein GWI33_008401 [Rhynchophorus ferrugineus]|uniref:Uncharacterized protein n=1 Tax=Rhynchophorus ferrugineus TaxID=354439 RepID=A0A834IIF7_RHYFE|nr:hypothetical protein GWI33_008401 [Rhynchophorus ferrugineus]
MGSRPANGARAKGCGGEGVAWRAFGESDSVARGWGPCSRYCRFVSAERWSKDASSSLSSVHKLVNMLSLAVLHERINKMNVSPRIISQRITTVVLKIIGLKSSELLT